MDSKMGHFGSSGKVLAQPFWQTKGISRIVLAVKLIEPSVL